MRSQDAAFIAQALVETGLAEESQNEESMKRLLDWLDKAQIRNNRESRLLSLISIAC